MHTTNFYPSNLFFIKIISKHTRALLPQKWPIEKIQTTKPRLISADETLCLLVVLVCCPPNCTAQLYVIQLLPATCIALIAGCMALVAVYYELYNLSCGLYDLFGCSCRLYCPSRKFPNLCLDSYGKIPSCRIFLLSQIYRVKVLLHSQMSH
jgi:hypothetical protein